MNKRLVNVSCSSCKHWRCIKTKSQMFIVCDITHAPKQDWDKCKAFKEDRRKDKNNGKVYF